MLLAYTNFNFGDDIFVKTICLTHPELKFELEAKEDYINVMSSVTNLKIIGYTKLYKAIKKIDGIFLKKLSITSSPLRRLWLKKYMAVVYVVGGLFDDDDLWEKQVKKIGEIRYKDEILRKSFSTSIPFYLLGCNMTRIRSERYIKLMEYVFYGIKDICFRDRFSYENFKLANTRYAPDLAFNYPISKYVHRKEDVLISVWGDLLRCDIMPQWKWAEDLWKPYKEFLVEIIKYLQNHEIPVTLLSLCENEGDMQACEIIMNEIKPYNVSILNYRGNTDEVIDRIAEASFVVGSRFHSVVMAMSTNTPVYPIAYESKTLQLIKDSKFVGEYSDIQNLDKDEISKFVKSFNLKYCCEGVSEIKEHAKEQFLVFDKFIKQASD